eukprot:gene7835-biopygen22570
MGPQPHTYGGGVGPLFRAGGFFFWPFTRPRYRLRARPTGSPPYPRWGKLHIWAAAQFLAPLRARATGRGPQPRTYIRGRGSLF